MASRILRGRPGPCARGGLSGEFAGAAPGETPRVDQVVGAGRSELAVSVLFAGPGQVKGTANATRERQT